MPAHLGIILPINTPLANNQGKGGLSGHGLEKS